MHSANKMIDYNIDKVKARVQFMSLQERRNLVKVRYYELLRLKAWREACNKYLFVSKIDMKKKCLSVTINSCKMI